MTIINSCIEGFVDLIDSNRIEGWVICRSMPARRARVSVRLNSKEIASGIADISRKDLTSLDIGFDDFSFSIPFEKRLSNDELSMVTVFATLEDDNFNSSTQEVAFLPNLKNKFIGNAYAPDADIHYKNLIADIYSLAQKYLKVNHTGYDKTGTIAVGPNYQTVSMNGKTVPGFRQDNSRNKYIDALGVSDGLLLDIGSNLGEMSRRACTPKNITVGIEYDRFTSCLSNLISMATESLTHVTVCGDVADLCLPKNVKHILAFSVFRFIGGRLADLSKILDGIMLIETHDISESGALDDYWARISANFKYISIVGNTDHGHGQSGRRLMFAVSNDRNILWKYFFELALTSGLCDKHASMELSSSDLPFLNRITNDLVFLKLVNNISSAKTIEHVSKILEEHMCLWASKDFELNPAIPSLHDAAYWRSFMAGYLQWLKSRRVVHDDNIYSAAMFNSLINDETHEIDFKASLLSGDNLKSRVHLRFLAIDKIISASRELKDSSVEPLQMPPIILFKDRNVDSSTCLKVSINGESIIVSAIDGFHRIFASAMLGLKACPAISIEYSFAD